MSHVPGVDDDHGDHDQVDDGDHDQDDHGDHDQVDDEHCQDVSKAFHRAARDLPFMPLKFPAEGDFNNEEVFRCDSISSTCSIVTSIDFFDYIKLVNKFKKIKRLEILGPCCMRLLASSQTSLMSSPLLSLQWDFDLI